MDGSTPDEVLFVPDFRESNPYQRDLEAALADHGVAVEARGGRGVVLPVTRTVLAAGRPSVLHLHFLTPYMSVTDDRLARLGLARAVSALLGLRLLIDVLLGGMLVDRTVWTAHNLRSHRDVAPRTERLLKHVFVRVGCDAVIVHCDRARDRLVETLGLPAATTRWIHVVPHGQLHEAYRDPVPAEVARADLDISTDGPVILFFGWIREYKKVPELIAAFGRLDREDARLFVVGNPATEQLGEEISRLAAADDRVQTRLEFVPDDEVHRYLSAADVVATPFDASDQSLLTSGSVVLAMGFGRAVVAPRLGCVPRLLTADPAAVWTDGAALGDGSGGAAPPPVADAATASGAGACGGAERPATERGAGVSIVPGGVLYDRTPQLDRALARALAADTGRMGERNERYVAELDWDRIAARTASLYADHAG
jgi:glycosyltransferase involved in cell wall biosynthesis